MKAILFISLLATIVPVFGTKGAYDLQSEKFLNFLSAIQNTSTFSYFTVIKAKNLNTGETKEICTKGNFVSGALHVEMKMGYSQLEENKVFEFARKHKDRYFEFKDQIVYTSLVFVVFDIAGYAMDKESDTPFSGLLFVVLLVMMAYTVFFVRLIEKRRLKAGKVMTQ